MALCEIENILIPNQHLPIIIQKIGLFKTKNLHKRKSPKHGFEFLIFPFVYTSLNNRERKLMYHTTKKKHQQSEE